MGQENPWKTNNQEYSSESLRGQNPWVSNDLSEQSESNEVILKRFPYKSDAFRYGYDNHLSPKGVVIPAIAVCIPVIGILAFPLVPLFTAMPINNEKVVSDSYIKKKPEATTKEIYDVQKGVRLKRWRNSGIGTAIGATVQAILLYLIIEGF